MTQPDFISLWQSEAPDIKAEALKYHIHADLALRRRFRIAILTAQALPVFIALWVDIQGLISLRWAATFITLAAFAVQIYKMERDRSNRQVPIDLTPRAALESALRQNKINIRNAWMFSDVIPLSGIIGGLTGGLLSRFLMNTKAFEDVHQASNISIILILLIPIILGTLLASHLIGKRIKKQKKAERAILRERLILLEAGLV